MSTRLWQVYQGAMALRATGMRTEEASREAWALYDAVYPVEMERQLVEARTMTEPVREGPQLVKEAS